MTRSLLTRVAAVLCVALASISTLTTLPSHSQAPAKRKLYVDGVLDSGQFLPDSAVLARIGKRQVTVFQFRDGFYAIYPTMRPRPDSLGRVEFLGNIVRKEILAQVAIAAARPMTFEDRTQIRAYGDRLLANVLYMREVDDSLDLSEEALLRVYSFYGSEVRMRHLFFTKREEADRTRLRLLRGQLAWGAALAAYGLRDSTGNVVATEKQWVKFENLPPDIGMQIWPLRVGEFSPVLLTAGGYHLVQVVDSRARTEKPIFDALRSTIKIVLRQVQLRQLRKRVQAEAMAGFDLKMDSLAIRFAASKFNASMKVVNEGFGTTFAVDASVPEFAPYEEARAVARWNGRRDSLTIGDAVHAYSDLPILGRPSLNTPEDFEEFCLNVILEPRLVLVAKRRGFEADPEYKELVTRKEEEIRVTHMVEDSIFSRVVVSDAERRKYYEEHREEYRTYPSVRYAMVLTRNRAAGDSMKAIFDRGGDPDAIVAAYKQKFGDDMGKVDVEHKNEPTIVYKNLFEELTPGKSTVNGPDARKQFYVVKSISRDDGRILPYEEAQHYVDESLTNLKAEAALEAFVDRHRAKFRVESHPELVMKIRLVDTASD